MKYLLKIPIYKYNTGRADNGNAVIERSYSDKEDALNDRDFLNRIFGREEKGDLPEDEYDRLQEILDWQGYQIKEAYVTTQYENLITQ
ncbi:MAG: hypothetical protein ABFC34_09355 [Methanobacterium sp.]